MLDQHFLAYLNLNYGRLVTVPAINYRSYGYDSEFLVICKNVGAVKELVCLKKLGNHILTHNHAAMREMHQVGPNFTLLGSLLLLLTT